MSCNREVDPVVVRRESGAPDDVRHLEHPSVLEQGVPIAHPDGAGHPLDPGSDDVLTANPPERDATRRIEKVVTELSSGRGSHRQPGRRQPHDRCQQPVGDASGPGGLLSGVRPGEPNPVMPGNVNGDLGTRVAGAHNKDSPIMQLVVIAVLGRMQLDDGVVELGREGRYAPVLVGTGGHHDVVCDELVTAESHPKATVVGRQPAHLGTGSYREPEPVGVRLQVVGGLILGGIGRTGAGKGHARQPAVGSGGE